MIYRRRLIMQVSNCTGCLVDNLEHHFWVHLLGANAIVQRSTYKNEFNIQQRSL